MTRTLTQRNFPCNKTDVDEASRVLVPPLVPFKVFLHRIEAESDR